MDGYEYRWKCDQRYKLLRLLCVRIFRSSAIVMKKLRMHEHSIYPLFLCIFHLSFNCAFHSTNKIDQKWPTTSHRRWCYPSWNSLIFRTDTHTYLFYTITNLYIIWYTPWYLFIILARNADTYMTHIAVSKYMLTDDIWRITYISGNYNVRAFTWYAYSW